MKIRKLLFISLVTFLSTSVQAVWTSTQGKVNEVISHDGYHLINTTITDVTCSGTGNFWWPADDPDAEDMLSIALTAFVAGKNVKLVHDDVNPACLFSTYNKATHIRIRH